ncbi:hypothetical protein WJX72_010332 [[Myrmecia] bisecta]|uniref:Guanylate kinase 1 n=1 Tax=[Myrmecia] bisecta TaxID=41462 RepID=A0AAW1PHY7_9CHLO
MGAEQSTEAGPQSQGYQATSSQDKDVGRPALPSALVICGPSGVGKGTLIQRLQQGSDRFGFSCSHTTRKPRAGEQDNLHYHFTTKEQFEKEIAEGKFLEYAYVHDNIYGTSLKAVQDVAAKGKCCLLDIDVQGARQVRKSGLRAIFVFIAPPSEEELEHRLRGRGTESEEQINRRLAAAKQEIASIKEPGLYDYVIFNDDLEEATLQLTSVAERALAGKIGNGTDNPTVQPASPAKSPTQKQAAKPQPAQPQQPSGEASSSGAGAVAAVPKAVHTEPVATQTSSASAVPAATTQEGLARWQGKVALVTGASAGIGWATCELLALSGLRVVAVARRRDRLEALQQTLVAKGVPIADFLPVVCDITKEAEVVALPRIIVKRWPDAGVDVLVNNAGMGRNNAALFDGSTASWVEMISTNVLGVCMCTREAIQDMKRRGTYGHIINVSSLSGHRVAHGASGGAFYAATKHALKALTEGLRQEARGHKVDLRVSSISPGMVETEFNVVSSFGNEDVAKKKYEQFKCLEAADIAQAVLWCLASPDHMEVNDILIRPTAQVF